MSRLFDGATQFLNGTISAINGAAVFSAWVKPDTNKNQTIMGFWPSSGGFNAVRSLRIELTAGGLAQFTAFWTDGFVVEGGSAVSANTVTLGEWNHVFGWQFSSSSRGVILNGGTEATDTAGVTTAVYNQCWIGAHKNGPSAFFDGAIAEAIVWDVNVLDFGNPATQDWAQAIYHGRQMTPWQYPNQCKAYFPLRLEEDRAWYGATSVALGATGSPTTSDDPVLSPPWGRFDKSTFKPVVRIKGRTRILGSVRVN